MAHFSFELGFASRAPLLTSKIWLNDDEAVQHAKVLSGEWPDATFVEVREGSRVVYGTRAGSFLTDRVDQDTADGRLDEALNQSFPASDPISVTSVS